VEPRDTPNPREESPELLVAIQSCAGYCRQSGRTSPITCEGACAAFAHWILSQHPDPTLRTIFQRTLARSRRSIGAAFVILAVLGAFGCARSTAVAAGAATHELKVVAPAPAKLGEQTTATIRVLPKKPYKINLEFPLKLKLGGPAGAVTPTELQLGVKQAAKLSKEELLLKPSFTLQKSGSHAIKGSLRFSVCTDAQCEIKQEAVSFTIATK
jgi:hypothetical protein